MINKIKSISVSIATCSYLVTESVCVCVCVWRTLRIYSVGNSRVWCSVIDYKHHDCINMENPQALLIWWMKLCTLYLTPYFPHPPSLGNHCSILWFYEFDNSTCNEIIDFFFLCLTYSILWVALSDASNFMSFLFYVINNQSKKYPLNIFYQLVRV